MVTQEESKVAIVTPKMRFETLVEVDTFFQKQNTIGKQAYKYGFVTAGLNGELCKMNETLKDVKIKLIDGGMEKDNVIIEAINKRILTNIF